MKPNNINKYIGIDVHLNRLTIACIDEELNILSLENISANELYRVISEIAPRIVAVDAPYSLNTGIMNDENYRISLSSSIKGHYNKKVSEYMLSVRGVNPFSSPGINTEVTGWYSWMNTGFEIYKTLEAIGYKLLNENDYMEIERGFIETFPHACFTVLAGFIPSKKSTQYGLDERMELLNQLGFKELHSNLKGSKHEIGDRLDALAAAYTAYTITKGQITFVGDLIEGQIALPTSKQDLKDMYKRKPAFEGSKKIIAVEMEDKSTNKSAYNYIYTNVDSVIWIKYFKPVGNSPSIAQLIDLSQNPGKIIRTKIINRVNGEEIKIHFETMKNRTDGIKIIQEHKKALADFWGSHGDKKEYEIWVEA